MGVPSSVVRVLVALLVATSAALADPVADFYRGKQVQIYVGYGAGGGYDAYARLIARHLGRHIPGEPRVVVQNMPGAGSLRAANFIFNRAPNDGTALATFGRNMIMLGLFGANANVQFDPRRFTWLGSPSSEQDDAYMLWVRKDAQAKTLAEARAPGGPPLLLGGTADGSTETDIALLMKRTAGLNVKISSGYPDSNAINIALDRGELEGRFIGLSAVASTRPEWLKPGGIMQPLMQFARATRHPRFRASADRTRRNALPAVAALCRASGCAARSHQGASVSLCRCLQGPAVPGRRSEASGRHQPGRPAGGLANA